MLSHRQLLERNLEWRPNETALVDLPSNQTYTYEEFDSEVNKLANALRDRGLRKGDRVAMVLYNTLEFPVMLYAIYKVGAVPIPANYMLAQDNFKYIFDDVNPEFVVYDADVGEKVEGAIEEAVRTPDKICVGDEPADGESYDVVRSSGTAKTPPEIPMNPGDVAYILYTSGTTGAPKGVTFSGKTAFNRAQEGMLDLGLSQDSVALQVSPWFHAGGIDLTIHPTICAGGTILVTRDWEPEPVAALIEDRGITHIVGVPTVAQRIANMDDVDQRDFSSLECMMCMGSPLSEQLANNLLENLTPNIYNGYGTTETLLDSTLGSENLPEQAGTVGRASPDKQVRVVEFDQERDVQPHEVVPAGEEGEVIVSGGAVLDYYFGNQEATDESLRRGWYYTGDLGVRSVDGFLTITGRADDMILSGGELVSPIEVEETLEQHEAVEAAAVVGESDEEWGQVVKAYVATDGTVDKGELETFCKEHTGLADYKRPRVYELVDELARTATGKKQRYKYRA
ncbi:acyl--CoA ligase [Natronomonas gomsonensis]|uniref:class I adenylate-forming enzyme family protein n=1 Tax=Natronomonas gomsonensis TaxID=1046043 RepID=UPI0020CA3D0F|nr:class I adenylate-forming enzyme family protein [Natronomonas gomsonensis]MCY4729944.1 acyl--CoA ligase [Natronomonas gomsonensis]